jgi:FAD/FMN-containing dehydrogenase/Fe-S oxidoreductase
MEDRRPRIIEDLTPVLQGEIRCDPLTVSMYATDGSLYQLPPLGVVFPRHRDDVVALVQYAAQERIPLIPRGAGTGLAGESLGPGLVVDFSRHMRQIEAIGATTVRVQPGVVCRTLNEALLPYGRYFPPDPSGASVTTVGSMVALDAAGSHSVRVGSTRDHVDTIELVLASGNRLSVGDEPIERNGAPSGSNGAAAASVRHDLVTGLARLLAANAALIAERQPPLLRNRCGYHLRGVLDNNRVRLARMLVGSEGTLGLFTGMTLHTAPLPAHRGVVLLLFGHMDSAIRAVQAISQQQPSACDLLDRRLLTLARDADIRFRELIPAQAEAALIVEQTGFSPAQIQNRIRMVIACAGKLPGAGVVAHEAYSLAEVDFLWSLPEKVVPMLARLQGTIRPLPFVEDVAVPPEILNDFLVRAQNVFQKHRVTASVYAHAAAGQVHLRPFLPPPAQETATQLESIARDLYTVVFQCGGTISGEHGTGLSRSAFVREQYGPLYEVFVQIKQLFDPHNLMNPGKVLTDDPHLTVKHLRPSPPPQAPAVQPGSIEASPGGALPQMVSLQLRWKSDELWQAAARCNGCGHCRTQGAPGRMCPVFRNDPAEEASPRAKANLMRQLMGGQLALEQLATPEFKRIANLCFNCKQCQLECPSNVNIPQLMIEAKGAYVAEHGLPTTDWILSRAHAFRRLGSMAAVTFNWLLSSPVSRWLLEQMTGISRHRKLPTFARRSFLRSARRELITKPVLTGREKPVVYFVDHFANYHDPELGRAFVAILRHNRIAVHAPPGQLSAGMAMISAGDLESARELARENLRELADLAREGCPIVCTEPAAALCLKFEYPMLIDHPDVEMVASRVMEAGEFLAQLHAQGRLRIDFAPLELVVGYHTPCHLKALGAGTPLADLLRLIPRLEVRRIDEGCSGMAGAWGLTRQNFRESVRIGWGLISRMRGGDLVAGVTECSSCKMQMEQGNNVPTLHPIKLLALSYGLMPEIQRRLKPSRQKLAVS